MTELTAEQPRLASIHLFDIALSDSESQKKRRARFEEAAIAELASSIREHGVLQPIIVRPKGGGYELVAGERRYRAAREAGLEEIPAVVRDLSDEKVLEVQLIENLQREDLHPMEEAEGYAQLMKVHGHPIEDLHVRVGKSRSYVYGRIKLLSLTPKARDAFYDGRINASTALLIARIPVPKLQDEALDHIVSSDFTSRRAADYVHQHFMLRLKEASFPTDDATLPGGPCSTCPKRTGNQPELFGDVKSADVCTDPDCFASKTKAHGDRAIKEARSAGLEVITGKAAAKAWPWDHYLQGYARLDERNYYDHKNRKNRSIVGPDVKPIIIQDPRTGRAVEVVRQSVVDAALRRERAAGGDSDRQDDGTRERQIKAKAEKAFRMRLYEELRPKLRERGAYFEEIAAALFDRLEHDAIKLLCKVRGFEPPRVKAPYGSEYRDYRAVGKNLDELSGNELELFICDCIFARELLVSTWSDSKPELLLAAAKELHVDAAAIRRAVNRGHRRGEALERRKKTAKTAKSAKKKAAKGRRNG